MQKLLYTLIAFTFIASANAQVKDRNLLKMANTEFAELRYAYAIPLYKRYIQLNQNDANATLQLAKCYQINNQYDSAIKYTKLANQLGADAGNILPELWANKGDYNEAVKAYYNANVPYAANRKNGFSNIDAFASDELSYKIHYLAVNTSFNEFAAIPYKDGLVFESNRAAKIKGSNEFGWDGSAYSKLYFTTNTNSLPLDSAVKLQWTEKSFNVAIADLSKETSNDVNTLFTKKYDFKNIPFQNNSVGYFDEKLNSKFNVGAISFSADSTTAYFTKNQSPSKNLLKSNENEKHLLEVWSASIVNGKLDNFKKLSFNKQDASYFHPVLSKNEKRLYFISDQVGGMGGTDLYYAEKDVQGNWGSPINAGNKINTAANELYPTVANGDLYISSNGHAGLGGLDIYKVLFQNDEFIGVENVGVPVNSATDDMSISRKGNVGYFVSNRYGTDDIFSFEYESRKVNLNGKVFTSDGSKPAYTVSLFSENPRNLIETKTIDNNSSYSFMVLPNAPFFIEVNDTSGNKAGLVANSKGYVLSGKDYIKTLPDILVQVPVVSKLETKDQDKVTFNNIVDSLKATSNNYFQLHHEFDMTAIVKEDKKLFKEVLQKIKGLKNANIIVISAADCMGEIDYNEKLSSRRADAITEQLKMKNKKNNYISYHLGERVLAEPCDFEQYDKVSQKRNRYSYIFIKQ